jgi:uncharacterized protein
VILAAAGPAELPPYPGIGAHWKARFGGRIQRISLNAGFSCPNRDGTLGRAGCAFCDPSSFSPSAADQRPVSRQLSEHLKRPAAKAKPHGYAAYFQPGTNTYAPLEELRAAWDTAAHFPEVLVLCVGTRPDCVPEEVLDLLASYGRRFEEVWLELGLQSGSDDTLRRLARGHTAADFEAAYSRAHARGLLVCAHVILGLPGEGPQEEAQTAELLARARVEGLKLHHLAVIEGTPLAASWRAGEFRLLTEEEYAERAAAFLRRLPPTTVVHRLVGDSLDERLLAPRFRKDQVIRTIRERLRG